MPWVLCSAYFKVPVLYALGTDCHLSMNSDRGKGGSRTIAVATAEIRVEHATAGLPTRPRPLPLQLLMPLLLLLVLLIPLLLLLLLLQLYYYTRCSNCSYLIHTRVTFVFKTDSDSRYMHINKT